MSGDLAYLMHIRDSLREVEMFIENEDYESFLGNRMLQNAVMRSRLSEKSHGESVSSFARLIPKFRGV